MSKTYTNRVQTVLTDEQLGTLARLSRERDKPLSALIREAVEEVYCAQERHEQRQAALRCLLALDAPVADWPRMEEEIAQGHHA